tara:strand:- start:4527 stop:5519 length:993 start_codon:yes stop_codon:yes gene_type:complete
MAIPLIAGLMMGAARTAGTMARGASRGATAGGGANKDIKDMAKNQEKMVSGGFIKKLAIGLGVTSILKMSKGFTALVGSFFQIIGAFVDVLVAPFLPLIFKGLGKLASFIPKVQTWTQGLFDKVSTMEGTWLDKGLFVIKEAITALVDNILKPLWDVFFTWAKNDGKALLIEFINSSKDAIQGAVFGGAKGALKNAWETVKGWAEGIWTTLQTIFSNLQIEIVKALNLIPGVDLDNKISELERSQQDLAKELANTTQASNFGGNQMAAGPAAQGDPTPQTAAAVNFRLNGNVYATLSEAYSNKIWLSEEQQDAEMVEMFNQQSNGFIYIE